MAGRALLRERRLAAVEVAEHDLRPQRGLREPGAGEVQLRQREDRRRDRREDERERRDLRPAASPPWTRGDRTRYFPRLNGLDEAKSTRGGNSRTNFAHPQRPPTDVFRGKWLRARATMLASVNSTYTSIVTAVFSSAIAGKVWFATALRLRPFPDRDRLPVYGKLPKGDPGSLLRVPIGTVHRWSGRLAFVLTLPVAFHCIFILGFQTYDTRVLVHSILGTFFYGASR